MPTAKPTEGKGNHGDTIECSTGNIFADLGFTKPQEMLAKAELARRISQMITQRGLTQATAAKLLGVDQPKISALIRGRLDGFSMDRLFRFLNALGSDVEIIIRPAAKRREAVTPGDFGMRASADPGASTQSGQRAV